MRNKNDTKFPQNFFKILYNFFFFFEKSGAVCIKTAYPKNIIYIDFYIL